MSLNHFWPAHKRRARATTTVLATQQAAQSRLMPNLIVFYLRQNYRVAPPAEYTKQSSEKVAKRLSLLLGSQELSGQSPRSPVHRHHRWGGILISVHVGDIRHNVRVTAILVLDGSLCRRFFLCRLRAFLLFTGGRFPCSNSRNVHVDEKIVRKTSDFFSTIQCRILCAAGWHWQWPGCL